MAVRFATWPFAFRRNKDQRTWSRHSYTQALWIISFQWADSALIRTFGYAALLAVFISYTAVAVVVPTLAAILIRREKVPVTPEAADSEGSIGLLHRFSGFYGKVA